MSEGVALGCCGRNFVFAAFELPLFDHVHRLNGVEDDACATKNLKFQHRPNDPLDRAMILLHRIVEIFDLAQLDVAARVILNALDYRRVRAALADGNFLGHTMKTDRTFQKATGSRREPSIVAISS